jgi:hypothetical protein
MIPVRQIRHLPCKADAGRAGARCPRKTYCEFSADAGTAT